MEKEYNSLFSIAKDVSSTVSLILLCGIPGVGKSHLSRIMKSGLNEDDNLQVYHFEFDNFFFRESEKVNLDLFRSKRKEFGKGVLSACEKSLGNPNMKTFVLVDDNFYLKSMRKSFYKFCLRNCEAAEITYLELHLVSDVSYALLMNEKREGPRRVPNQVIQKMAQNFQNSSFRKDFCVNLEVCDQESLNKINFRSIFRKLESNRRLLKFLKKDEENSLNKIVREKEAKETFLDYFETKFREKVGEAIKENKGKIDPRKLSQRKKESMNLIKSIINNTVDTKTNSIISHECKIRVRYLMNSIKEEGYCKDPIKTGEIISNLLNLN